MTGCLQQRDAAGRGSRGHTCRLHRPNEETRQAADGQLTGIERPPSETGDLALLLVLEEGRCGQGVGGTVDLEEEGDGSVWGKML